MLYHFNGEFKANDFISEVKNALILEKQLPYLEKQFYDDPSNGDKCLTFLVALKKGSERKELNPIAQRYFLTQTDNQLVNSTNWRIIANGVSDIKSRPFQFVLHHQKEFEAVSSPIRFQKKIVNIVAELLEPYTVNIDTLGYYKKRVIAKSIHLQKTDSLIFTYDIAISERDKNWASYKKITLESTEKYVWSDTKVLKEIATNYLQNFADMASFKYAIRLAQHSIDIKESYDGYILLAKLNQKTKNTKDAIKFVKKAKDWNTALGWKTKDADDLLSELITK